MTVVWIILAVVAVQFVGVALFRSLARANERFDADGNVRSAAPPVAAGEDVGDRRIA